MSEKELMEGTMKLEDDIINLRLKQLKKEEQRFWSNNIDIPLTLHEGLHTLTRDELHEIRKNLGIKGISKLKKSELVDLFAEKTPEYLERICGKLDEERFKLLIKIAKNNGVIHVSNIKFSKIRSFRTSGLLFTGNVDGENVFILPNELIEPLLSMERNLNIRSVIKRNTEWINLTTGLLYYYGTLSSLELQEMLPKYTKAPYIHQEFDTVMKSASAFYGNVIADDNGYSHMDVQDPGSVRQEHSMRKNISFYPFNKGQILKASDIDFVDRNKSYMQLVNYILKNIEVSKEEVDAIVEDCVFFIQQGVSLGEVLNLIGESLEFESDEHMGNLVDKVVDLMNNTRQWYLKGYTPNELSERDKSQFKPLPEKREKVVKVGRNDPCPCGSQKKYKKCCGR